MRKIKYVLWLIIVVLLAAFIYQNNAYFMDRQSIVVNLGFDEKISPELPNLLYFVIVFLVGFILSFVMNFSDRWKKRKTIKQLNQQVDSGKKRIDELEAKLMTAQGSGYVSAERYGGGEREEAGAGDPSRS